MSVPVGKGLEKVMRSQPAARVPLRVDEEVARNFPQPQGSRPREEAPESPFDVLVGDENDQIPGPRGHPRTPAAKSTPRFVSLRHSARAGCSLPLTMSVAPSGVFAKQRTCSASTMFRMTGEWVARSTWAS